MIEELNLRAKALFCSRSPSHPLCVAITMATQNLHLYFLIIELIFSTVTNLWLFTFWGLYICHEVDSIFTKLNKQSMCKWVKAYKWNKKEKDHITRGTSVLSFTDVLCSTSVLPTVTSFYRCHFGVMKICLTLCKSCCFSSS